MYVHLTTHSAYSLLRGVPLPAELAQAARAEGMPALGLTDYRTLTGAVEFVQACRKAEVRPILGLEVDGEGGPLTLLATSLEGWSNLCRLSTALALSDDPVPLASCELLAAHSQGLLALAPETAPLEALKEIFAGALYLALSQPARGVALTGLGRKWGIPLAATCPVYYLTPAQANLQRTLASIRTLVPLAQLSAQEVAPAGAYFAGVAEMEARFEHFPAALAGNLAVAERCQFELPLGIPHMPTVPLPPGQTPTQTLRLKAEAGARRLYGTITPQIQSHLDHEIEVIARMGFEPIFLIVEDILDFARRADIPYSSRGSAASSLVAHCLGITSPDPLRLNLYFERFLNPARTTPPDIDTDLCSDRRDEVIQHVFDTYGADRVAMVGTINRFRPRSAFGDVAKAHGLAPDQIREMSRQLPGAFWARFETTEEGKLPESPFAALRAESLSPLHQAIFSEAEALLKLPRHLSVHAGGILIAPGQLTDLVPVQRSGSKGVLITQLDLESVEALGLVKIDLLGIRGLTVMGDVAEFIRARQPQQYASRLAVLDSTPQEDPATSDRIETGQTIGCFQIESPGMRATLREIHARTPDDVMAALALFRPGPLTGGLKDAFVRRFQGKEQIQHIHPALAPLLADTFGVILYQEQVLRIAHDLAGFSLAEADLLRRAMTHFDPGKHMQELEQKFLLQSQEHSGVPLETGERIWEMMAAFSGYGFPQAHAASYAQVAWRSTWCKTHFPAEFMAAVLANWGGYYSQRVYLSEARRMGLVVHPPHVNYSGRNFVAAGSSPALYMGLDQIKGLTARTILRILQYRPYHSLEEFLVRVDPRPAEAESLAQVDAFAGLEKIPTVLRRLHSSSWRAGQMSLFDVREPEAEDWTVEEKVAAQQEWLGIGLDAYPLELYIERLITAGAIPLAEAAGRMDQRVTVAGVRQSSHRSKTAKGDAMMFLSLEDLSGMLDVVVFPDAYRASRLALGSGQPLLITGLIERDDATGEPFLKAEKIVALE
jgi:DNA-directed DNA polymerase III (polc)